MTNKELDEQRRDPELVFTIIVASLMIAGFIGFMIAMQPVVQGVQSGVIQAKIGKAWHAK